MAKSPMEVTLLRLLHKTASSSALAAVRTSGNQVDIDDRNLTGTGSQILFDQPRPGFENITQACEFLAATADFGSHLEFS